MRQSSIDIQKPLSPIEIPNIKKASFYCWQQGAQYQWHTRPDMSEQPNLRRTITKPNTKGLKKKKVRPITGNEDPGGGGTGIALLSL